MLVEVLSKLASESLLSLYPVFVQWIRLPIQMQIWTRFFSYFLVSAFFVNPTFIANHLWNRNSLILSLITLAHVFTSYRGFLLLESGIAYLLFYTYPLMILFFSGKNVSLNILIALLGVFLIYNEKRQIKKEGLKNSESSNKTENKEWFPNEKWVMIFLAALTEAAIYFVVRNIKTENAWNHMFLSYFLGFVLLTVVLWNDLGSVIQTGLWKKEIEPFYASIGINAGIGLFGYLLRFFAMYRLEPVIYSILSYFGVFMAFIYGVLFNGYTPSMNEIIGSLCILFSLLSYWIF